MLPRPRCSAFPATALGLAALLAATPLPTRAGDNNYVSASEARLTADVSFLADDLREGRGVGTEGIKAAGDYIAAEFKKAGLQPAPGANGYFQNFTIPGEPTVKDDLKLTLSGPGDKRVEPTPKTEFSPLAIGGGGTLEKVPVVFAGYGITAKDDALKLDYDDYEGLDVKGKAVLILRREPQLKKEDSPFAGTGTTTYASFRHKARNAADHGAAAVLLVNDTAGLGDEADQVLDFPATGGSGSGIPFLMLTRATAEKLLAGAGAPGLADLEKQIDEKLEPLSRPLEGWTIDATVSIDRNPIEVRNVVGVLEGAGPQTNETIVIGGHYDHLGRGGSGSLAFGARDIHNGADDNASGTALVIELARRLGRREDPLPRRLVFMAFSAEERGLLGSRHYVDNPLFPLADTVAMLNFDMVGRLNEQNEVTLYGAGSTAGLEDLAKSIAASQGLKPNVVQGASMQFGSSDHASFYFKDIPVLFAFTGLHDQYHRPTDDSNLINFDGMDRIANFAELMLLDFALRPERPTFVKLPGSSPGPVARRGGGPEQAMPYLGTRPDYGATDVKGVKLDGVAENSPAQKAGLQGGDVITKIAGQSVLDLEDFMDALSKHKAGDKVDVIVKRGEEEKTIPVTLGTRSGGQ